MKINVKILNNKEFFFAKNAILFLTICDDGAAIVAHDYGAVGSDARRVALAARRERV